MISLRSLVLIPLSLLLLTGLAPGWAADGELQAPSADAVSDAAPADGASGSKPGKLLEGPGKLSDEAAPEPVAEEDKVKKKHGLFGKSKDEDAAAEDKDAKPEKKKGDPPPPTAAEIAAAEAAAERAKVLKSMRTPFNTASSDGGGDGQGLGALSLPSRSLRSSLSQRLVPNRVYLPGKMIIGKAHEFVVKGRPGSQVAVAMADKDAGAKPIVGHDLRLGPDRKLVAAGTIPETGILTLIVDMPIQGDLIGLPVFFETVIWQKPDFSDLEIASPVKSETVAEFADKPNAVVVVGEAGPKGRAIKFDTSMPAFQRNPNIQQGRL